MVTITGATGKTGSVVATTLLAHGETVRVIGRSAERLENLGRMGAQTAAGDQGDAAFLTKAFDGADAVYLLIPPKFDAADFRRYYNEIGDAAVKAIRASGVKKAVFLSSLGADKPAGTGPVIGLHDVEKKLGVLADIDIVFLRPGYFMENTLGNMELIREKRIDGFSIAPDASINVTASADIGAVAADLLLHRNFLGHTFIEIIGDRLTYPEMTRLIGNAVGIPDLPYVRFSDADAEAALTAMGLSTSVARSYIELGHGIENGLVAPVLTEPGKLTAPTRFATFAEKVFKPAFAETMHHTTA